MKNFFSVTGAALMIVSSLFAEQSLSNKECGCSSECSQEVNSCKCGSGCKCK